MLNLIMVVLGAVGMFVGSHIGITSLVTGADFLSAFEQSYEIFGLGAVCAWLGAYK